MVLFCSKEFESERVRYLQPEQNFIDFLFVEGRNVLLHLPQNLGTTGFLILILVLLVWDVAHDTEQK